MTHHRPRPAFVLVALCLLPAAVAGAQGQRIPPRARVEVRADSGVVPPRDPIIPPTPARPAGQVGRFLPPTPGEPVRPAGPVSPPPVFARAVRDTSAVAPAPLARLAPPALTAALAPTAPMRALNVSDAPPAGVTARCKDGSYLAGGSATTGCADRGGVVVTFAPARAEPPRP